MNRLKLKIKGFFYKDKLEDELEKGESTINTKDCECISPDACTKYHGECGEPIVDAETEKVLQEFYEENKLSQEDIEHIEKENIESSMETILKSKAFPYREVEVTYNTEDNSYTFKLGEIDNLDTNHSKVLAEEIAEELSDTRGTYQEVEKFRPKKLKDESNEQVNHPDHYNKTPVETLEQFFLMTSGNDDMVKGALLFNIMKYTSRAGHKGDKETDNEKTEFYLDLLKHLYPGEYMNYRKYQSFKKRNK